MKPSTIVYQLVFLEEIQVKALELKPQILVNEGIRLVFQNLKVGHMHSS